MSLLTIVMSFFDGADIPFGGMAIIVGGYWFIFLSPFDISDDGIDFGFDADCSDGDSGCD